MFRIAAFLYFMNRPIQTKLVEHLELTKEVKAYALYIKLKYYYDNGVFYNYTVEKTAVIAGVHPKTIKKYFPVLEKIGLIKYHAKNLCLLSLDKTDYPHSRENTVSIFIPKTDSINQITRKIRFSVVKKDIQRQRFITDLKSEYTNSKRIKIGNYKKYIKPLPEKTRVDIKPTFLNTPKVIKQLNISRPTLSLLLKNWQDAGLCNYKKLYKKLGRLPSALVKEYQSQGSVIFQSRLGISYLYLGNSISI